MKLRRTKRILSLALCVALLAGLVLVAAPAAMADDNYPTVTARVVSERPGNAVRVGDTFHIIFALNLRNHNQDVNTGGVQIGNISASLFEPDVGVTLVEPSSAAEYINTAENNPIGNDIIVSDADPGETELRSINGTLSAFALGMSPNPADRDTPAGDLAKITLRLDAADDDFTLEIEYNISDRAAGSIAEDIRSNVVVALQTPNTLTVTGAGASFSSNDPVLTNQTEADVFAGATVTLTRPGAGVGDVAERSSNIWYIDDGEELDAFREANAGINVTGGRFSANTFIMPDSALTIALETATEYRVTLRHAAITNAGLPTWWPTATPPSFDPAPVHAFGADRNWFNAGATVNIARGALFGFGQPTDGDPWTSNPAGVNIADGGGGEYSLTMAANAKDLTANWQQDDLIVRVIPGRNVTLDDLLADADGVCQDGHPLFRVPFSGGQLDLSAGGRFRNWSIDDALTNANFGEEEILLHAPNGNGNGANASAAPAASAPTVMASTGGIAPANTVDGTFELVGSTLTMRFPASAIPVGANQIGMSFDGLNFANNTVPAIDADTSETAWSAADQNAGIENVANAVSAFNAQAGNISVTFPSGLTPSRNLTNTPLTIGIAGWRTEPAWWNGSWANDIWTGVSTTIGRELAYVNPIGAYDEGGSRVTAPDAGISIGINAATGPDDSGWNTIDADWRHTDSTPTWGAYNENDGNFMFTSPTVTANTATGDVIITITNVVETTSVINSTPEGGGISVFFMGINEGATMGPAVYLTAGNGEPSAPVITTTADGFTINVTDATDFQWYFSPDDGTTWTAISGATSNTLTFADARAAGVASGDLVRVAVDGEYHYGPGGAGVEMPSDEGVAPGEVDPSWSANPGVLVIPKVLNPPDVNEGPVVLTIRANPRRVFGDDDDPLPPPPPPVEGPDRDRYLRVTPEDFLEMVEEAIEDGEEAIARFNLAAVNTRLPMWNTADETMGVILYEQVVEALLETDYDIIVRAAEFMDIRFSIDAIRAVYEGSDHEGDMFLYITDTTEVTLGEDDDEDDFEVGDRTSWSFYTVVELVDANNTITRGAVVRNLGAAELTFAIPYEPSDETDVNAIAILNGAALVRSYYADGDVLFTTNNLTGTFAITELEHEPFTDRLSAGPGMYDHIVFVATRGLFVGEPTGRFNVGGDITYREMAAVLSNHAGENFTDYPTEHLNWARANGIFEGVDYEPEAAVTRADMAQMIYNYINATDFRTDVIRDWNFSDIAANPSAEAIIDLASTGIISGDAGDGGTFRPLSAITRQEVAAIMAQFVKAFVVITPTAQ